MKIKTAGELKDAAEGVKILSQMTAVGVIRNAAEANTGIQEGCVLLAVLPLNKTDREEGNDATFILGWPGDPDEINPWVKRTIFKQEV